MKKIIIPIVLMALLGLLLASGSYQRDMAQHDRSLAQGYEHPKPDDDRLAGLVVGALAAAAYLAPAIVAVVRKSKHDVPIYLLNLFAGWTVAGWVVALVWASMPQRSPTSPPVPTS